MVKIYIHKRKRFVKCEKEEFRIGKKDATQIANSQAFAVQNRRNWYG